MAPRGGFPRPRRDGGRGGSPLRRTSIAPGRLLHGRGALGARGRPSPDGRRRSERLLAAAKVALDSGSTDRQRLTSRRHEAVSGAAWGGQKRAGWTFAGARSAAMTEAASTRCWRRRKGFEPTTSDVLRQRTWKRSKQPPDAGHLERTAAPGRAVGPRGPGSRRSSTPTATDRSARRCGRDGDRRARRRRPPSPCSVGRSRSRERSLVERHLPSASALALWDDEMLQLLARRRLDPLAWREPRRCFPARSVSLVSTRWSLAVARRGHASVQRGTSLSQPLLVLPTPKDELLSDCCSLARTRRAGEHDDRDGGSARRTAGVSAPLVSSARHASAILASAAGDTRQPPPRPSAPSSIVCGRTPSSRADPRHRSVSTTASSLLMPRSDSRPQRRPGGTERTRHACAGSCTDLEPGTRPDEAPTEKPLTRSAAVEWSRVRTGTAAVRSGSRQRRMRTPAGSSVWRATPSR